MNKRRASLTLDGVRDFLERGVFPSVPEGKNPEKYFLRGQVLREIARFLEVNPGAAPVYYVAYDRVALFAKEDRELRFTFDKNIRTKKKEDLSLCDDPDTVRLLPEGMWLMETKIASALPLWLTAALSELGVRQTSFSKVGRAFETFETGVPSPERIERDLSRLPQYRSEETAIMT